MLAKLSENQAPGDLPALAKKEIEMNANFNGITGSELSMSDDGTKTAEFSGLGEGAGASGAPKSESVAAKAKPALNPNLIIALGCVAVLACGFIAASMAAGNGAARMDYNAFLETEWQILLGILGFLWDFVTTLFGQLFSLLGFN